ncbi:hypothetical protein P0082_06405 [Candidatus Haliotispira prima]|uniref:Uncharacterized protein n=1 Tax=Candidatus Haliotispira prima TaxID=3034016 RepID=A0ABY8MDP8_9SPIO|nr:hypothetical protein P0082_06405 [Candidatus Haliotispira prima]
MAKREEACQDMPSQVPSLWRESFAFFSDDSLHLLAKLYFDSTGLKKIHSRELMIEALWHHANREEFSRISLESLSSFDMELLLLLYLGSHSIHRLSESLPKYSCIEISLQLLHLQERLLVLRVAHPPKQPVYPEGSDGAVRAKRSKESKESGESKGTKETVVHLIPKVEKQLHGSEGASFVIAPQFSMQLQEGRDFCAMFHGRPLSDLPGSARSFVSGQNRLPLLLSSELLLAGALYFARESFPSKRKISKAQLARCRDCFSRLDDEQIEQLRRLSLVCGLLRENDPNQQQQQQQVQFSREAFEELWYAPYYQRLLALQARVAGLSGDAFAKLLCLWPQNVLMPGSQLQRFLSLMGIAYSETEECIRLMLLWRILCRLPAESSAESGSPAQGEVYYLLNPQLYSCVLGTKNPGNSDNPGVSEGPNRLSSNWELYCDLRHPEIYIDLLLCSRLEKFDDLSLFRMEKPLFQGYFNAESPKFEHFMQCIPQLERCGLRISEFICQQWQEWFHDSTRFQLFKNCLLICQPSYNELISRLLAEVPQDDAETGAGRNLPRPTKRNPRRLAAARPYVGTEGPDIVCNPQPGVFYLNERRSPHWLGKLEDAGVQLSKPFSEPFLSPDLSVSGHVLGCGASAESMREGLAFPIEMVASVVQKRRSSQTPQTEPARKPGSSAAVTAEVEEPFPWDTWPTASLSFVESRRLVCSNANLSRLHIHFREARGVDYTAKRNLLHSLLTARNHMAIITVAEGDEFDLVPYTVLPLGLDGPKEDPGLLALDLRRECLLRFRVKTITRVNEVFYSVINVCLLSLLPGSYIFALEAKFLEADRSSPESGD